MEVPCVARLYCRDIGRWLMHTCDTYGSVKFMHTFNDALSDHHVKSRFGSMLLVYEIFIISKQMY